MSRHKDVPQGAGEDTARDPGSLAVRAPASVTRVWVTLLGLAGLVIALAISPALGLGSAARTVFILVMTAAPVLAADLVLFKVHRRSSTGLDWSRPPDFSFWRSLVKVTGLAGTLLLIALMYWVVPEYRNPVYREFFDIARLALPYLIIPTVLYFFLVDAYMIDPNDGYWHAGCFFLGLFSEVDRGILRQYALGWLVKAYFIPFMMSLISGNANNICSVATLEARSGFVPFYDCASASLYLVDGVFANIGYVLTLRVTDTHIRSTEPTMLGWLVALICYVPFWPTMYDHYYPFGQDLPRWEQWLAGQPILQATWGTTILCLAGLFSWATMMFGCRFSNLTHRGILTNGPYRWTKHPAYLAKNISWWLVAIPFASGAGLAENLRLCLMLAVVNFIYFMRARTEEWHLSRDPDYVAYALWMNEHGLLKWLGAIIPVFRYRPPAGMPPRAREVRPVA